MKMTVQYMSDLARWAEEHKDEIPPFLPVEETGWIDQCKHRFPVAKRRGWTLWKRPVQRLTNAWCKMKHCFPKIVVSREIPQWILSSNEAAYHPHSNTIYLRSDRWWKDIIHEFVHWFFCLCGWKSGHFLLDGKRDNFI